MKDDAETTSKTSNTQPDEAPMRPSSGSPFGGPNKEIDPGYFVLTQGGTQVGRIWVTSATNHEHWQLFSNYTYPSSTNATGRSIDVTSRFQYKTPGVNGAPRDLQEFLNTKPADAAYFHLIPQG